jgi:mannose-6-phosphate isomerase
VTDSSRSERTHLSADGEPFGGAPVVLPPNQPTRPYRGGAGIATFRGRAASDDHHPEDFVASTTEVHGASGVGLSRLPNGQLLRDAVRYRPTTVLGPEHVAAFGASTELLVKLLHTGQRLFLHYHPDADFAARELGEPRGKTEAWIVLDVSDPAGAAGHAFVGFAEQVNDDRLRHWIESRDSQALLAAMHTIPLLPGTAVFVPAGLPHAIGPDVTLVELQEPSDLSMVLETWGFDAVSLPDAWLGGDIDSLLRGLDSSARTREEVGHLLRDASRDPGPITPLLPEEAEAWFRAERIEASLGVELEPAFAVLVVTDGQGILEWGKGEQLPLRRGMTVLTPYGMGPAQLTGTARLIRCRPPAPNSARRGTGRPR